MLTKTQLQQETPMNILTLLEILIPVLSKTDIRRMRWVTQSMLNMTGRVTMLGISRWSGKGGSYRTIQRYFNTKIVWLEVFFLFFKRYLYNANLSYLLAGDESVYNEPRKLDHGLR